MYVISREGLLDSQINKSLLVYGDVGALGGACINIVLFFNFIFVCFLLKINK